MIQQVPPWLGPISISNHFYEAVSLDHYAPATQALSRFLELTLFLPTPGSSHLHFPLGVTPLNPYSIKVLSTNDYSSTNHILATQVWVSIPCYTNAQLLVRFPCADHIYSWLIIKVVANRIILIATSFSFIMCKWHIKTIFLLIVHIKKLFFVLWVGFQG